MNLGKLGFNLGLQALQFVATSTTAENQALSTSLYIHSISSNKDNQDIVSMGTNAALATKKVIENTYQISAVLSIAIVYAVSYLDIENELSPAVKDNYLEMKELVNVSIDDVSRSKELAEMVKYLEYLK